MPIRILPPDVAARIAAGQVVERPASVVKELVENALDAGAEAITVEITAGGASTIRVADDGSGIAADEMELAFERHATSKLSDDSSLSRVATLGFRGEALPSIAAVARVEIVSRPPAADAARRLILSNGSVVESSACAAPVGTSVRIDELFAQLPARRAFLRSAATEANAIYTAVSRYALARPGVRFRLVVDGRQTLHTPGNGHLWDAAAAVLGLDAASAMLAIESGGGSISVSGLTSPPDLSRAGRSHLGLFVNGRWIQNRRLTYAIESAYQGLLMVGRHPLAVLNIDLDPAEVDVNVHPTKSEVRFRDESAVFSAVQKAVRATVITTAAVPTAAGAATTAAPPGLHLSAQTWTPPLWEAGVRLEGQPSTRMAVVNEVETPGRGSIGELLPVLRVIGQFGNIYIIAEGPDGIYLIDQHAAHERVLYEQHSARQAGAPPKPQGLLDPITIDLAPSQQALVEQQAEALAQHGFEIDSFGGSSAVLRAVPRELATGDVRANVVEFLDRLAEVDGQDERDRVAMSLACHGAIRAGKALSLDEMRELIRQLEACDSPNTCPHGRPTMVHMSADILARGFGRR